jgi:hypothetical protein
MGRQITSQKGTQYTLTFAASEQNSSGNTVPTNITGATIVFSVYDSNVNLNLIFSETCTITDAANGTFEFLLTLANTKRAGSFIWKIVATYANGNVVPWGNGIFKIEDLG